MSETAGGVNIVLTLNNASYTQAIKQAQARLDEFAGKTRAAGHATVSSMQAASASIRLLENPLGNNTRAIERLLSQSTLLSGAMKAAFPVVGAVALGSIFVDLGSKMADFVRKANAIPKAITQGFQALHAAAQLSNDELRLTNDRLQNEINKLQGKPQNNLAIAIDETRIAADKLSDSLSNDAKRVKDLLDQNKVGIMQQLFLGKGSTADVAGSVNAYRSQIAALGYQMNQATHNGDSSQADNLRQQINAKEESYLNWLSAQITTRTGTIQGGVGVGPIDYSSVNGNQDANLAILRGEQTSMYDRLDQQKQEARNPGLEAAKARLEANKEAARAALEAQKKAAADQLAQWETDNGNWKAEQTRSVGEDAAWWVNKAATFQTGATNFREVMKKVDADLVDQNRSYSETLKKYTTEYLQGFDSTGGLSQGDSKALSDSGTAAASYITSLRESIELNKQNADAIAESSIAMALATGQMSRLDAAQAMATLHTQTYQEALAKLQAERNSEDPTLSAMQLQARNAGLDNQISTLNFNRGLQSLQDNQSINPAASSGLVGFTNALDEFVDSTRDAARTMQELTTSTLGSVNGEIVKSISGQRTSWRNAGAGIFRSVASASLQSAEGSVLGLLGFGGKPDGSASKPLYVRIAGAISGAATSAGGAISSAIGGSSSGGGIISTLVGLLPHFATGGPISANMLSVVGENGPELFMPGTSGSVIPNHVMSSLSGGDTHHWNIDARGATDPAQTTAMITRALQVAAPQIVNRSVQANSDKARRAPASRR